MAAAVRNFVNLFTCNKEWGWPQKPAVRSPNPNAPLPRGQPEPSLNDTLNRFTFEPPRPRNSTPHRGHSQSKLSFPNSVSPTRLVAPSPAAPLRFPNSDSDPTTGHASIHSTAWSQPGDPLAIAQPKDLLGATIHGSAPCVRTAATTLAKSASLLHHPNSPKAPPLPAVLVGHTDRKAADQPDSNHVVPSQSPADLPPVMLLRSARCRCLFPPCS